MFGQPERYIAILHPLKAKYMCTRKRVKLIVLSIWLFSFVAALPILYGKVTDSKLTRLTL